MKGIRAEMSLVSDLFKSPDLKATRTGFGEGMSALGEADDKVVALCGDLSGSLKLGDFISKWPDRFLQGGVAEQNMVNMAVGLALSGMIPFATSFGCFMPMRTLDHIRISVCYNNANVKLVASHTGITVGPDGATHQALEDIAVMRVLPKMKVIVPADAIETKKATISAAKISGPVYLRVGRQNAPVYTTENTPFEVGKINRLRDGKDVAIVACGVMVYESLLAAEELSKKGIEASVLNCHTIKPIDAETLKEVAKECGAVVTAEEHQKSGGLGSAVAEVLVESENVPMELIGVKDRFGESGESGELMEKYGLTSANIVKSVNKILKRK